MVLLKRYFTISIIVTLFLSACASVQPAKEAAPVAAPGRKAYRIDIEGMHCKMCVQRVTKGLRKIPQVSEVTVDLEGGFAEVILSEGQDVAPEVLMNAVEDSGYKPTGVEVIQLKHP